MGIIRFCNIHIFIIDILVEEVDKARLNDCYEYSIVMYDNVT